MRKPSQRGLSLLTAMVIVAVLVFLVAAALVFTGQEVSSAAQHRRKEGLSSCVTAARNFVLSQIRTGATGKANNQTISGELNAGDFTVRTGHLDQYPDAGSPFPIAVTPCPLSTGGGAMIDLTNTSPGPGGSVGGRSCLAVVAHCIDNQTGAREEVEFQVRLSL